MGELGLHGITVAEEYDGVNLGYLAHVLVMEQVSCASASVGLLRRPLQPLHQSDPPPRHGGAKARYLPRW